MAARYLAAFAGAALLLPGTGHADDKLRWKNPSGTEITLYGRPGTRMLRVSFQAHHGLEGALWDQAVRDSLKAIAQVAHDQSSETFAITNMYCSTIEAMGFVSNEGCAIEGAWLKPGERILTLPKDNRPVYFSTAAALAKQIPSDWVNLLDTKDGLTGKVDVVATDAGSPITVLGNGSDRK